MRKGLFGALALAVAFAGCEAEDSATEITAPELQQAINVEFTKIDLEPIENGKPGRAESSRSFDLQSLIAIANDQLAASGLQIEKMEYLMADDAGREVFFSDRGNKQLSSDYVPFDERHSIPNSQDIPYLIDDTQAIATRTGLDTRPAINAAMNTWNNVTCSKGLDIYSIGETGFDFGLVQFFFNQGGAPFVLRGGIVHAGNLPASFFNLLAPGGGNGILGVTFTLVYVVPGTDIRTDVDNNGKDDVAIKEIYYNDGFPWTDFATIPGGGIDFETVALHEVGHALSQQHFGELSFNENSGKFQFSPRALMNAGYTGVNRNVAKTDKAGHCSNWGDWPNN